MAIESTYNATSNPYIPSYGNYNGGSTTAYGGTTITSGSTTPKSSISENIVTPIGDTYIRSSPTLLSDPYKRIYTATVVSSYSSFSGSSTASATIASRGSSNTGAQVSTGFSSGSSNNISSTNDYTYNSYATSSGSTSACSSYSGSTTTGSSYSGYNLEISGSGGGTGGSTGGGGFIYNKTEKIGNAELNLTVEQSKFGVSEDGYLYYSVSGGAQGIETKFTGRIPLKDIIDSAMGMAKSYDTVKKAIYDACDAADKNIINPLLGGADAVADSIISLVHEVF